MANANISLLTLSNVFFDEMVTINNEANSINELRNGNYYKDGGNFTVANGTIISLLATGTGLQIVANSILGGVTTLNSSIHTNTATFLSNATFSSNSIFNGTQLINGNTLYSANAFTLRNGLSTTGNGSIVVNQGTTNGNAVLIFNNVSQVWQATANATVGYSTLLAVSNIADSISNSGVTSVASANAVEWAYNTAISSYAQANSARSQANSSYAQANLAYTQANSAYAQANTIVAANASALVNNTTKFMTGVAAVKVLTSNSNSAVAVNDPELVVSIFESGKWEIDCMVYVVGNINVNTGFKANLNNTTVNGSLALSLIIDTPSGLQASSITNYAGSATLTPISNTTSNWIWFKGLATVTNIGLGGIIGLQFSQLSGNASSNVSTLPGSYLKCTKIG